MNQTNNLFSVSYFALINIKATFNNTLISVCDHEGNVLIFASAGSVGFKGAKRATPFAAQVLAEFVGNKMLKLGLTTGTVFIKGIGKGRNSAVLGLKSAGIVITKIMDKTHTPHNGCRPKKRRRI